MKVHAQYIVEIGFDTNTEIIDHTHIEKIIGLALFKYVKEMRLASTDPRIVVSVENIAHETQYNV